MLKKYLLIVLVIVAIGSVVYIFFASRQQENISTSTPKKPSIPSSITGTLPLEMSIKKSDFNFPNELPIISLTPKEINKSNIEAIAAKLGMGTELNEFEDVNDGLKYYKSTDNYFFVATPKTSVVKYGMVTIALPVTADKKISDEGLVKIATDFLTQNGFYNESQIEAQPVLYLKTTPTNEGVIETGRSSAQLFQVGFTFKSSRYEILTDYSQGQQIYAQILPDGTIYNSETLLIEEVKEGITNYPLKTYEDLVGSLDEAKLISLSGDYISPSDLTIKDVLSLKIEKVRLVYFLEKEKNDLLQPIFVFDGPAQVSGSLADSATIYLPAFK